MTASRDTVASTRRSRRPSDAVKSSSVRCSPSTRPCSETAKSTRSPPPLPCSVSCAARTRRSRTCSTSAIAMARTAIAAAAIAIQPATEALNGYLPVRGEAEEDRIRRLVVVELHLAGHLADDDVHRGLGAERGRRQLEVREGDGRPLLRVERRDRFRLGVHLLLEDAHRERDGNSPLREVPRVLERDLEGEVCGHVHRRRAGDRERLRLAT